jgi:hypothetical protein
MPILFLALLVLAPNETPPPSPNIDLPAELDICILQAEVCALEAEVCGVPGDRDACIKAFSDCASPFPEAKQDSCRMDYAWCKLTEGPNSTDAQLKLCSQTYDLCPTAGPQP